MDNKPTLLYASPFPPQKSGISDYSVILVKALSQYYKITIYTDDYGISSDYIKTNFTILKNGKDDVDFNGFDYRIYNIGNNPDFHGYIYEKCLKYPGLIILHDYVLYYLYVGYYASKNELFSRLYQDEGLDTFLNMKHAIRECGGVNPLEIKQLAEKLPLNKELLLSGNKIMVHSEYAFKRVKQFTDNVKKINMIQQVNNDFKLVEKKRLFEKYHIPKDTFVVSSFGIIAETKQNHLACEAIKQIAKTGRKICYVMVGEGDYINDYVDNDIVYKTGFVDMNTFDSFVVHSDLVLNLRYPSMGETSAALLKILQMGKACIINNQGWFAEVPDTCSIKIDEINSVDVLKEKLEWCLDNLSDVSKIGENARNYIANEYGDEVIVNEIKFFLDRDNNS